MGGKEPIPIELEAPRGWEREQILEEEAKLDEVEKVWSVRGAEGARCPQPPVGSKDAVDDSRSCNISTKVS